MSDVVVKANSEDVGLRRESSLDVGGLPLWLARLHRALPVDAGVRVTMQGDIPIPWPMLLEGAGFADDGDKLVRQHTLADTLAPNLRAVVVGLNPSLRSAEMGYSYAGQGNRFWEAAVRAGLLTEPRNPEYSLTHESVGFTDLAKRATPRANEISAAEFRSGLVRLQHVFAWMRPRVVIVAGLTGWRHAIGERSPEGWQSARLGDSPVYLMPNPSGLNAATSLDALVEHLRAALAGAPARNTTTH